jgi:hypothetical protein
LAYWKVDDWDLLMVVLVAYWMVDDLVAMMAALLA